MKHLTYYPNTTNNLGNWYDPRTWFKEDEEIEAQKKLQEEALRAESSAKVSGIVMGSMPLVLIVSATALLITYMVINKKGK